ncbi:pro-corazonin-like [Ceratina calcarata]|uniref:Pro-corazonin n=1 Tax=Ceratina calcarata TaxID=156304 RepID=A0AAJ7IRM4_9HYME|nr:pro-corazonin-like [Ceratina calcarata]
MVNVHFLVLFVLSSTMVTVMCQTFQYSHGWTNGKRSTSPVLEELVNSVSKNPGQLDNVLVNCELQNLRLLVRENINDQLLQLPCELFFSLKKSVTETMANDHFHRQPSSTSSNY